MASPLSIRVITPEQILIDTAAVSVSFPTVDGSVGILSGHAPMVAAIGVGELGYRLENGQEVVPGLLHLCVKPFGNTAVCSHTDLT